MVNIVGCFSGDGVVDDMEEKIVGKIVQHIPAFARDDRDGAAPEATFNTLEELLAVPFVAPLADTPDFYRWSHNDNYLMLERFGGRWWWVVGYLDTIPEGLPEWDHGIAAVWDEKGQPLDLPGKDVKAYCGDDVTMKDGRHFKERREDADLVG